MKRAVALAAIGIVALSMAGCSGGPSPAGGGIEQLDNLRIAIDNGSDCSELFTLFDQIDEGTDVFLSAQGELANVGCLMRESERNDAELGTQAPNSPWLGVPGEEITPSATCNGAAKAAAMETDSTRAEPLIAATLDACETVDEWMSVLALYPGVMGMRDGYIPQLLDLQAVCYTHIATTVCQGALSRGIEVGP